ncbi:MAG: S49 family peptidase, partial [Candidatus Delongbacteria bacterium]|nr:S49 family peptidase [Candidatus Delongbacteria bacterium]
MKKFFKVFFITVGVLATLLFVLFIVLIMNLGTWLQDKPVTLSSNQYLKIDLSKSIPEMPVEEMDRLISKSKYNFYQCIQAIDHAGKNDKIIGIYLRLSSSSLGWAQTEELTRALKEFKTHQKPVYVYFEYVSDKEYMLASVADKVYCSPQALVFLDGLNAQLTFFKDMFKKVGIEFQTIRHGKYKSAVEPFVQNTISEENRRMITEMLMSISRDCKSVIQSNRPLENLESIVAEGPYLLVDEIRKLNLVDSVVLEEDIYQVIGIDKKDLISVDEFIKAPSPVKITSDKKIALVLAEGDIMSGKRKKNMITDQALIGDLKKAYEDKNVAGIVLRINSPGGSGGASDNIWQYIEAHKNEKPLVVSMGNLAASGGYYIAMNSRKIYSSHTTLTGSIGVFFLKPVLTGLMDKLDLNTVSINTDPHADFFATVDTLKSYEKEKLTQYI